MVLTVASGLVKEMTVRITPERRDDILDAAVKLLRGGGLAAVTTAALAREAKCSKETLYALFENRDTILAALVERQAGALNAAIRESQDSSRPVEDLVAVGAQLLSLLTSEASLAINRAALADPTGNLSRILIKRGKEKSAPRIISLMQRLNDARIVSLADSREAYRTFYGLLIADRQILALHGATAGRGENPTRIARRAVEQFLHIYKPGKGVRS